MRTPDAVQPYSFTANVPDFEQYRQAFIGEAKGWLKQCWRFNPDLNAFDHPIWTQNYCNRLSYNDILFVVKEAMAEWHAERALEKL